MIKKIISAFCFGLIVALVAPVQADVRFGIDATPSLVPPGGASGSLVFYAQATSPDNPAAILANAYSFQFDVTAFGGATASQLSFGAATPSQAGWTTIFGGSAIIGASGNSNTNDPLALNTNGNRLNLFVVPYTVAASVTNGMGFNLDIQPFSDASGNLFVPTLQNSGAGNLITGSDGIEATISAVPEPTSLGFLVGAAGLVALRRRRKSA